MNLLIKQYELLLGSRMVMFDFIERELPGQFTEPVAEFNGSSARNLLVHTANTYKNWLGNFGMGAGLVFTEERVINDVAGLRDVYNAVDRLVYDFTEKYQEQLDQPIINQIRGKEFSLTPLKLFTHVITHEFHHKGQVMAMCRLLGFTPPDTDVIRT